MDARTGDVEQLRLRRPQRQRHHRSAQLKRSHGSDPCCRYAVGEDEQQVAAGRRPRRPPAHCRYPCRLEPTSAPTRPRARVRRRGRPGGGTLPCRARRRVAACRRTSGRPAPLRHPPGRSLRTSARRASVGRPGKWPAKKNSSPVSRQTPDADSPGTIDSSSSTNRNGARCGSSSSGGRGRGSEIDISGSNRVVVGRGRGSDRGSSAVCRRSRTARRLSVSITALSRSCSCSRISPGGAGSCLRHTTIGTPHESHSAIQHSSSLWNHSVNGVASHSSQVGAASTLGTVRE